MNYFVVFSVLFFTPSLIYGDVTCPSGQIVNTTTFNCVEGIDVSECSFSIPSDLETLNPTSLVPGRFRSGIDAILGVQQAFTENRLMTHVILSEKSVCNYPGPNWVKSVDIAPPSSCMDTYFATIPWNEFYNTSTSNQMLYGCGLTLNSTDPSWLVYSGKIEVIFVDKISINDTTRPYNFNRTTTSFLNYEMSFPTSIMVSTTNLASSDPRVLSAIIGQVFNASNGELFITLVTSLQYPYKLSSIDVVSSPVDTTTTENLESDCADVIAPCEQEWLIVISRTGNNCDFTGNYNFSFTSACQTSDSNCPLDSTPFVSFVGFQLVTENVCAIVSDTTVVTGLLSSWDSYNSIAGTFSNAKYAFLDSQTVYYSLQLTSDSAALGTTTISDVTATNVTGNAIALVTAGSPQISGYSTTLVNSTDLEQFHELQFKFDPTWFGKIPQDGSVTSTVTVTALLDFNGKRDVVKFSFRAAPNSVDSTTEVIIVPTPTTPNSQPESAGNLLVPTVMINFIIACCLIIYELIL